MLEYNVRFGDPETQAVLPRLRSDLLDLLERATRTGGLAGASLEWDDATAVTVVLASAGYPESRLDGRRHHRPGRGRPGRRGHPRGHRAREGDDIVTAGGRVLNVTALGADPAAARKAAYAGGR